MKLGKIHKLVVMLCVSALLIGGAVVPAFAGETEAQAAARTPAELNDMYVLGLMSHDWGNTNVSMLRPSVPAASKQQIGNARVNASWRLIEPTKDAAWVWTSIDSQITALQGVGVQNILITIGDVPAWAGGGASGINPPSDILQWKDFCGALAAHCHTTYGAIVDFYEIWNEPGWDADSQAAQQSGTVYFNGQVETDYLPLLQAAYIAIKANDPDSWVISGALNCSTDPYDLPGQATLYNYMFDDVNRSGLDNSVAISSTQPVIAERPMYFNYRGAWTGGHDVVGASAPQTDWYFAEGTTRDGFDEYLCLQNPNPAAVTVTVNYMLQGGAGNKNASYTVGAQSRSTVYVNGVVGANQDVAMHVSAPSAIIAERPMYFDYNGLTGGHDVLGAAAPAADWYFAEGTTRGGFDEYLCLQNPNASAASATVTYMSGTGETQNLTIPLAAQSRFTLWLNPWVGPDKDISLKVHATANIIAERPMYFNYAGAWTGGHDVVGVNSASTRWYFAEGTTRAGFDEYLCLQNPNPTATSGTVTFMKSDGSQVGLPFSIGAYTRSTVRVNDVVGPDQDVSMQVDATSPIIAERPMYFAYKGYITGGHDVMGALNAGTQWYFAEGFAGSGFEQYLSLQNPGGTAANVTITFMMKNGDTIVKSWQVPAHARSTVSVNYELGMRNYCDAIAIHPYVSPESWGSYCTYVNQAQAADGVCKQLVATEIGWPSQVDSAPGYYSESLQADAFGPNGLGGLWGAGVRKIWVYEDIDDPAGTAWEGRYYGMFRNDGSSKPVWAWYLYWHGQGY